MPPLLPSRVQVDNNCVTTLHLLVKFAVRQGPVRLVPGASHAQFTVFPNSSHTETIDPLFEWTSEAANHPLELLWEVHTVEDNVLLHTGTTRIRLLPQHYVVWDLTTPEGYRIGFDLLLSSLATWVVDRHEGAEIRCAPDAMAGSPAQPMTDPGLQRCYAYLFQDPPRVRIVPTSKALARAGTQVIKPPMQVVADGYATPLEAALLLGRMSLSWSQRLGGRVALFIIPQPDQPEASPQVLLAWTEAETGAWHALNMRRANAMAFADNETLATPQLRHVLQHRQDILVHLDRRGMFSQEDQPVVALDFTQAAQHTLVYGLP